MIDEQCVPGAGSAAELLCGRLLVFCKHLESAGQTEE